MLLLLRVRGERTHSHGVISYISTHTYPVHIGIQSLMYTARDGDDRARWCADGCSSPVYVHHLYTHRMCTDNGDASMQHVTNLTPLPALFSLEKKC